MLFEPREEYLLKTFHYLTQIDQEAAIQQKVGYVWKNWQAKLVAEKEIEERRMS